MSPLIPKPNPTSAASPPPPSSSPPPRPPPPEEKESPLIGHVVWSVLAGPNARIPAVGSRVYYFAQGHSHHCSSPPNFAALPRRPPSIIRYVTAITFHGDPDSGEVYSKITLDDRPPPPPPSSLPSTDDPRPVFFCKNLTQTDKSSWGFTAPAGSAEKVFPPLDWTLNRAIQMIPVREVDGTLWMMQHKYRKEPLRNNLTVGWTKFVEKKKPDVGDVIIFVQEVSGDLVMALRRLRDLGGWVMPESVLEAVRKAEMDEPFDVTYYPRYGPLDFLVGVGIVEAAFNVAWLAQMRVKMFALNAESGEVVELKGTVISTASQDPVMWPGSKWRMLEVSWDGASDIMESVNTWDVATLEVQEPLSPLTLQEPLPQVSAEQISVDCGSTSSNASGQLRKKVLRLFGINIEVDK